MSKDTRLVQVLDLIARIFVDMNLSTKETREMLEEIKDDVEIRMETLDHIEKRKDD
jgi:hypothetical protein